MAITKRPTIADLYQEHPRTATIHKLRKRSETLQPEFDKEAKKYAKNRKALESTYAVHNSEFEKLRTQIAATEAKLVSHEKAQDKTALLTFCQKLRYEGQLKQLKDEIVRLKLDQQNVSAKVINVIELTTKCNDVHKRAITRLGKTIAENDYMLKKNLEIWRKEATKFYNTEPEEFLTQ